MENTKKNMNKPRAAVPNGEHLVLPARRVDGVPEGVCGDPVNAPDGPVEGRGPAVERVRLIHRVLVVVYGPGVK